jgi:hypothetical protein
LNKLEVIQNCYAISVHWNQSTKSIVKNILQNFGLK